MEGGGEEEEEVPLAIPLGTPWKEEEEEDVSFHPPSNHNAASARPVGITVITGYLGSGKTTLVNHILKAKHGKRIAVILNEFGEELGIEKAMINHGQEEEGTLVEEWIDLPNGCVCCSVKHSFIQALEQLMERREKFNHILLETTGLANPGPIASTLWIDDQLESSVYLDSIITVVDAKNLNRQLEEVEPGRISESFLQIAFADIVILNKVDLLTESERESDHMKLLEDLKSEIYQINSLTKIVQSVHCKVNLEEILDCRAFDMKHSENMGPLLAERSFNSSNFHDTRIKTICICEQEPVILNQVDQWLGRLLWERDNKMEILRAKGILHVHESNEVHMLQAVREIYEIMPVQLWRPNEERTNKIVFIGKDLDAGILSASLKACTLL